MSDDVVIADILRAPESADGKTFPIWVGGAGKDVRYDIQLEFDQNPDRAACMRLKQLFNILCDELAAKIEKGEF